MKPRSFVVVLAVTAAMCLVPILGHCDFDNCLIGIWTAQFGVEIDGTVHVKVGTIHVADECGCSHSPGYIYLHWKKQGEGWQTGWPMSPVLTQLCYATYYDVEIEVDAGSTIDIQVWDTADENCILTELGFHVP